MDDEQRDRSRYDRDAVELRLLKQRTELFQQEVLKNFAVLELKMTELTAEVKQMRSWWSGSFTIKNFIIQVITVAGAILTVFVLWKTLAGSGR